MLQLLYPCSQYSSDRCLLCGGTFRDHLTLWWAKHLYTPFDRFVDRVYRDGVVREIESSNDNYSRKMKALPSVLNEPTTEYAFHRRYVLDISHVLRGITSQQQRTRVTQRELAKWHPGIATDRMQQRRFSALNDGSVVSYAIPKEIAYEQYLKKSKPMTVATWLIVREMFLAAVERLMDLEATDQ